jgi:ABC-type branched-subunit amino acid transport system substrate-binding protein
MVKIISVFLSYIFIIFNTNLIADENDGKLRIGLLAPLSGDYKDLGTSLLLSTQLALGEINDDKVVIIPRDSGSDNKEKLNSAIEDIIANGAKIIIGPPTSFLRNELEKYNDTIFISLSNKNPKIKKNVINIGISLESQLAAIKKFLIKEKRTKTVILYPKNKYEKFIDEKIKQLKLDNYDVFKYNPDPRILTGEIEKLTNYSQRKKNLESRKKVLEKKDDDQSKNELEILDRLYTLGSVDFDSVIIIDFGSNLKSVLSSLVYTDVDDSSVLFTTVNQWFDESIFRENSVKNLYFPSINMRQFKNYNENYYKTFGLKPDEITILAYDALGLVYYVWNKNNGINSINDFFIKDKIKGKIGTFEFKNNRILQELKIYKTDSGVFKEY